MEVPHYYGGELVGTHRRYNDSLAMWLLQRRQPERYGAWIDRMPFERHPDGAAIELATRTMKLVLEAHKWLDEEEARAKGGAAPPGDAA